MCDSAQPLHHPQPEMMCTVFNTGPQGREAQLDVEHQDTTKKPPCPFYCITPQLN